MRYPYIRLFVLPLVFLILSVQISPAEQKPTAIGIVTPLTGANQMFGQSVHRAIMIAHGLKPAVLDRPVELHFFDTQSDDDLTSHGAELLIKEHNVSAVIDGSPGSAMLAGSSIAGKERTPLLYPFVTTQASGKNNTYSFIIGPLDSSESKAAALFANEILGAGRAAVMIDVSRDYSLRLSSVFMETFIGRGGAIVSVTYCQSKDRTLSEQITSISAAKPDLLYLADYPPTVVLTCQSLLDAELRISVIASVKASTNEWMKEGKDAVEGLTIPGHFDRQAVTSERAQRFIEAYEEGTEETVTGIQALAADAYFLLADAIERAQSPAGYKIRKALTETENFDALTGRITIDAKGRVMRDVVFHRIKEGSLEYLTKLIP